MVNDETWKILQKENCGLTEDIKSLQLKLELAQQETEDFRNVSRTAFEAPQLYQHNVWTA